MREKNRLEISYEGGVYDEKGTHRKTSALRARSNAAPKPKPISKNIPRRIFRDRRDVEGVGILRIPPYPLKIPEE